VNRTETPCTPVFQNFLQNLSQASVLTHLRLAFVPKCRRIVTEVKLMTVLLQEYSAEVVGPDGATYVVRSYGEERADGTWTGWLEFDPVDGRKPSRKTSQETSQPNLKAIEYWATGLEPIYFEGAFERAQERSTS